MRPYAAAGAPIPQRPRSDCSLGPEQSRPWLEARGDKGTAESPANHSRLDSGLLLARRSCAVS